MFRRPGAGRSKASADTLCQKCLKRGHYSYECKASTQERPYTSRPSRTQQLLNPKLKPKLTTEVPEDLLRKKGVADEILKKKEDERSGRSRKRSRSLSASSVDSVSTISTNRSPSRSRSPPKQRKQHGHSRKEGDEHALTKRARQSVSQASRSRDDSMRNTRRRMSSFSPDQRGRRRTRSRSNSAHMDLSHGGTRQEVDIDRSRGESRSYSRSRRNHAKRAARNGYPSRSQSHSLDRMDTSDDREPRNGNTRGSRRDSLPQANAHAHARSRSRSESPYHPVRERSLSPYSKRKQEQRLSRTQFDTDGGRARDAPRNRFNKESGGSNVRNAPPPQAQPMRERSLSPFSKRVALTKAMQTGQN